MLLQCRLVPERLGTQVAGEHARSRVNCQVLGQAGLLRERLLAVPARERPLPRVGAHVVPEVGHREARQAHVALVRLGGEVGPHVPDERHEQGELVPAHVAPQVWRGGVVYAVAHHAVLAVAGVAAEVAAEDVCALGLLAEAVVDVSTLFLVGCGGRETGKKRRCNGYRRKKAVTPKVKLMHLETTNMVYRKGSLTLQPREPLSYPTEN